MEDKFKEISIVKAKKSTISRDLYAEFRKMVSLKAYLIHCASMFYCK